MRSPSVMWSLGVLCVVLGGCGDPSSEELPPQPTCDLDEIKALTEPCPPPYQSIATWTRPNENDPLITSTERHPVDVMLDPPWTRKEGQSCAIAEYETVPSGRQVLRTNGSLGGWARDVCDGEYCGGGGYNVFYHYMVEVEAGAETHRVDCQADGDIYLTITGADDEPRQQYQWSSDGAGRRLPDIPPPST